MPTRAMLFVRRRDRRARRDATERNFPRTNVVDTRVQQAFPQQLVGIGSHAKTLVQANFWPEWSAPTPKTQVKSAPRLLLARPPQVESAPSQVKSSQPCEDHR